MPTRRQSIVLGAASVFAPNLVRAASINAWPDRTVHMVVPNAAGGPTDVNARIVAEQLSLTSAMPLWPTPILMVIHCYSVPHPCVEWRSIPLARLQSDHRPKPGLVGSKADIGEGATDVRFTPISVPYS
jgi:hypothetical protein